jgi:hypothetical protein
MSKFTKPKPAAEPSHEDIERVIQGADAVDARRDDRKPASAANADEDAGEVRFTMTLAGDMAKRVDRARKAAGGLTRLSWIRMAVAEKLTRDGV